MNGITISGRSPDEVVQILSSLDGTITFKLVPAYKDVTDARESAVRMKVDYNGTRIHFFVVLPYG